MRWSLPEPAVTRETLFRTAALSWGAGGVFLIVRAAAWVAEAPAVERFPLVLLGVALGWAKGRFVLSRVVFRNMDRIRSLSPHKGRVCVFAFQAVESYLLVAGMVAAGALLRASPLPRPVLCVLYLAVGTALVLASPRYLVRQKNK